MFPMKKTLLALALVTFFAATAQAETPALRTDLIRSLTRVTDLTSISAVTSKKHTCFSLGRIEMAIENALLDLSRFKADASLIPFEVMTAEADLSDAKFSSMNFCVDSADYDASLKRDTHPVNVRAYFQVLERRLLDTIYVLRKTSR